MLDPPPGGDGTLSTQDAHPEGGDQDDHHNRTRPQPRAGRGARRALPDGRRPGDPNGSPEYQRATEALFAVSYALRFRLRRELGVDRKVGPLEGLWAIDGGELSFTERSNWRWTVMIEQAEAASPELVDAAARAKGVEVPLRLERLREGLAAQVLHVGPFADEPATIGRLHAFIDARRLRAVGRHHEIYLRDPRRTAPERLQTIIRQPVVA
jgi:hypothetical protein